MYSKLFLKKLQKLSKNRMSKLEGLELQKGKKTVTILTCLMMIFIPFSHYQFILQPYEIINEFDFSVKFLSSKILILSDPTQNLNRIVISY